jgi:hypothetical protein
MISHRTGQEGGYRNTKGAREKGKQQRQQGDGSEQDTQT